jgi:DNA-binding transcriptional regulator YiaG
MPNIGAVLRGEISRLCRREIRREIVVLRKTAATHRHEIAALKRRVRDLQGQAALLAKRRTEAAEAQMSAAPQQSKRFVAKGLRSLRRRLGLSASDLACLAGVSAQSVYNWEHKKASPRKEQIQSLAALRSMGKREARVRLEALSQSRKRVSRKR